MGYASEMINEGDSFSRQHDGSGGNNDVMGMVKNLLDADDDGNIMDNGGKFLGGFLKKLQRAAWI